MLTYQGVSHATTQTKAPGSLPYTPSPAARLQALAGLHKAARLQGRSLAVAPTEDAVQVLNLAQCRPLLSHDTETLPELKKIFGPVVWDSIDVVCHCDVAAEPYLCGVGCPFSTPSNTRCDQHRRLTDTTRCKEHVVLSCIPTHRFVMHTNTSFCHAYLALRQARVMSDFHA